MYALMTLITAGVEAGADAMAKTIGKARRQRAMNHAEPLTDNAPGAPREVTGQAINGPVGSVTAPLSGRPCVWYAVTVFERYWAWRPGPLGPTKVVRHGRTAEQISGPLYVAGDTATVRVDAHGAELELGEPSFAEFADSPHGPLTARLAALLGAPLRPRHRERAIGFVVEERVIAAGDPLRVVGAARTELGDLVLGKSGLRPLIISRTVPDSSPED
ncbi:E3 ubiquitin ligase family protein [Actinoallomurus purpureus]|uniref:E3 ubiquitin ligase family protein n=1 Tax=Actinoallomurus purpureus TaxID=478114 RepID=UPI0020929769|nr:E3 ubiquitin ligase family protein [Actinoallomurus purpureus]MCO6011495.1 E3 ubiquitin ligase family protein [Actinoallomurus purpureus]